MALAKSLAWWEGGKLYSVLLGDSGFHPTIHLKTSEQTQHVFVALPGAFFMRRQHPKPFEALHKLRAIVPNFISSTSLKDQPERDTFILQPHGIDASKCVSYSINKKTLVTHILPTAERLGMVVGVAPIPFGACYFFAEQKKTEGLLIATLPDGDICITCVRNGALADFRTMTLQKWQSENRLTLETYLGLLAEDAPILILKDQISLLPEMYHSHASFIDKNENIKPHQILIQGLKQHIIAEDNVWIDVPDPVSLQKLNHQAGKLIPALAVAAAASLLFLGGALYKNITLSKQTEQIETATKILFHKAMGKRTPMMDATFQLARKESELARMTGQSTQPANALPEQLVNLQEKINSAAIPLSLEELIVQHNSLRLSGSVSSISEAEKLQNLVAEIYPDLKIQLKNVSVKAETLVEFSLEGSK